MLLQLKIGKDDVTALLIWAGDSLNSVPLQTFFAVPLIRSVLTPIGIKSSVFCSGTPSAG